MSDREPSLAAREAVPPGVRVEALCESCGAWHSVEVKPCEGGEPITKVKPVCWVCGHKPLVVTGSGRVR